MPESASSFMVGNAPNGANYAAPLVNFSQLAQLPNQYFEGQQQKRTLALQDAFSDGLPKNADGSLDINGITDKLSKIGGAQYAQQLMPYLIDSQVANNAFGAARNAMGGGSNDSATNPPPSLTPARPMGHQNGPSGPGNITGGAAPQTAPTQPALSSAGTDNNGSDTLRSVMTETFGGRDVSGIIPKVASALKIDPDSPLTPQQMTAAKSILTRIQSSGVQPGNQASPTTGGGAPVTPVSGTGGNGAPTPGTAPETAAPATGIVPNVVRTQSYQPQPQAGQPAQPGQPDIPNPAPIPQLTNAAPANVPGVPAGQDPVVWARMKIHAGQVLQTQAAALSTYKPDVAKSLNEEAKGLIDEGTNAIEYMRKATAPTDTQKDVNSGAQANKAAIDANIKSGETQLAGVRGSALTYEGENGLRPKVQLATAILNDPRIYTGAGGDWSKMVNRAAAIYGPTAPAQLQEMLEKVTAGAALAQVNGLKDSMGEAGGNSNAGRIFTQQVELINKASPQLGTTLNGNRALVELERRTGEQSMAVRDLALKYLGPVDANGVPTKHKFLDSGWDSVLSSYLQSHPLFTKDEMAEPTLLGAPTAPPVRDKAHAQSWINDMGLKPGDPYRVNGQIKMVPRITIPVSPANVRPGSAQAAPAPQ